MTKYKNKITNIDGIKFHSKKEACRYLVLKDREKRGEITDLKLQVPFILAPSVIIKGRKVPALRYFADFTYIENGKLIINDVKGLLTNVYKIKRHIMKVLGYDILET